jgi:hypothetical protein
MAEMRAMTTTINRAVPSVGCAIKRLTYRQQRVVVSSASATAANDGRGKKRCRGRDKYHCANVANDGRGAVATNDAVGISRST